MRKAVWTAASILIIACSVARCGDGISGASGSGDLRFTSTPITTALHNEVYAYTVSAEGGEGELLFRPDTLPAWLTFDPSTRTLTGEATADNLGSFPVRLTVSDSFYEVTQRFAIEVTLRRVYGGSWRGQFPYDWAHDGEPVIGDEVDLYSDASSDEVKATMQERAAQAFARVKSVLAIGDQSIFIFPPGRSKVDVYANRFNTDYYGGFAYHGGAIVLALDHPHYQPDQLWCVNQVEHELFHVVETLIEGSGTLGADVWFREGIADYFAGNHVITSVAEMNAWLATRQSLPGGGNPIKIHRWEDFPAEVEAVNGQGLWYPMFELAVRYLMDVAGLNLSYVDARELFADLMGNHDRFPEAFEVHMGLSLEEFEIGFFGRITSFLDQTS